MSADLLQQQLHEVNNTRDWYYSTLNLTTPDGAIGFDPALEIWSWKTFFTNRKKEFKEYELTQVTTSLKERFGLATNVFIYTIDKDGDLINDLIPGEKFRTFLERGILYRQSVGSKEQGREQAELEGFLKISKKLTSEETTDGTMMISISGPGVVEGTFYPKNFVDIYERTKDKQGNVVIKMTRFYCSNDYNEYIRKAQSFNPDCMEGFDGPIDAWFLKNPIPVKPQEKFKSPKELFTKIFNNEKASMEEKQFEALLEYCMPLITNFINLLCSDRLDPKLIALNENAILNKADEFIDLRNRPLVIYSSTREEMFHLGMKTVRAVDTACGISGGTNLLNRFDNSVARFGTGEKKWVENCGQCGKTIKAYISAGYKCDCGGVYLGC